MATCPDCGTSYPPQIQICPRDGTVLDEERVADPLVGRTLHDKYRVDGLLGQGGMGTVYRATHLMLGKPVALKLIKPELVTSKEIAKRFQREARAASNLNHSGIATVYDLGQTEDGTLYIAMEFVAGPTLKEVLADGPMAEDRIVRIVRQIATALAAAHLHQIVHRDLKPQNVVLTKDAGHRETAKLLDFGIAKTFEDNATRLTSTGIVIGTPQYMSPEQASGTPVDGRSDLYSLGVILYEMLTGHVPFSASSTLALLVKQMQELPVPPSRRRPDLAISPVLEAVALKCLEKDAANRYPTADDFLASFEGAVEPRQATPALGTITLPPTDVRAPAPAPRPLQVVQTVRAPVQLDRVPDPAAAPTVLSGQDRAAHAPASRGLSRALVLVVCVVAAAGLAALATYNFIDPSGLTRSAEGAEARRAEAENRFQQLAASYAAFEFRDPLRVRNLSKQTIKITVASVTYLDAAGQLKTVHSGTYGYPTWDIGPGQTTTIDSALGRGKDWSGPVLFYGLTIDYPGVEPFLKSGVWARDMNKLDNVLVVDLD